ncbi:hypothetical protein LJB88_00055 [Erysipelotrichaceae bacterium OttesenSCG-928-M19]|nr:hypothetical protein [Erysipelotrichaceae bacterium OttesenSCG-928-M19]
MSQSTDLKKANKLLTLLLFFVRLSNFIMFTVLLLFFISLISTVLLDRFAIDSYFTTQLGLLLVKSDYTRGILYPAIWLSKFRMGNFIFFTIFTIIIILLKRKFKKVAYAKAESVGNKIIASISNLIVNAVVMLLIALVFLNITFISFVNNTFENVAQSDANLKYQNKVDFLQAYLKQEDKKATIQLEKIIKDVRENKIDIEQLSDQEYIKLAKKVSSLINKKAGLPTLEEHYFRNNFSRAPATLDEMISTVQNDNSIFKWHLVAPLDSTFHMFNQDGEYNLKFLSEDGHFEAVYDIRGQLLTEVNDPINMGTFNYADSILYPEKHSIYDVLPYFVWNNTNDLGEILDIDDSKYQDNEDAQRRYEYIKDLLEN